MANLIRMDLFRMMRSKTMKVTLILAAVSALLVTPAAWGLLQLSYMFSEVAELFPDTADLCAIIADPFPFLNAMIAMIAASVFFYADLEFGYIKNIAGQMPKKGYTLLSKFIAVLVQNMAFMVVGVVCNLIGTAFVQKIVIEGDLMHSLLVFGLRLLLMQACCAILLLLVSAFKNKSLGSVMAVLMGSGLLSLVYMGINSALGQVIKLGSFNLNDYMPDQLLGAANPKTLDAILVSAVTIAIFLPLSIRVFDRRDIK